MKPQKKSKKQKRKKKKDTDDPFHPQDPVQEEVKGSEEPITDAVVEVKAVK